MHLQPRRRLVADRARPTAAAAVVAAGRRRCGSTDYVDHLSRTWLGKPPTPGSEAATAAVDGPESWARVTADTVVTPSTTWPAGCSRAWSIALLDTPDHMTT